MQLITIAMYLTPTLADFAQNWIFLRIFKVAQKSCQRPCTIVGQISPKMTRREFSIFITFSDTYTCTYVV